MPGSVSSGLSAARRAISSTGSCWGFSGAGGADGRIWFVPAAFCGGNFWFLEFFMDFYFDRTCSFEDDKEAGGAGLEVREGVEAGKGRSGGSWSLDPCFRDFVFVSFGGPVFVILGILYFCANFFFHISSDRLVITGFVRLVLLSLAFVAVVFAVFSFVVFRIRFPFRVSETAGLLLFISFSAGRSFS